MLSQKWGLISDNLFLSCSHNFELTAALLCRGWLLSLLMLRSSYVVASIRFFSTRGAINYLLETDNY